MYLRKALGLAIGLGGVLAGLLFATAAAQAAATNGVPVKVCLSTGHVTISGPNSSGAITSKRLNAGNVLCPNTGSAFQYWVTIKWHHSKGNLTKTTHCWVAPVTSASVYECKKSTEVGNRPVNKTPAQALASCAEETSLRQKVLCVAWSQYGTSETSMDGNSQPLKGVKPSRAGDAWHCNRYFTDTVWRGGPDLKCEGGGSDGEDSHWCAAFTRFVWLKAGVSGVPKSYSAQGWSSILRNRAISGRDIKAGDYVNWNIGNTHHSGIVVRASGSKIWVMEGNASDAVRLKSYTVGASGEPTGYYRMP